MLQLCFYTEAIASIQRVTPEAMHVLLGIGDWRTLRHADFAAYYRRVRKGFVTALVRREDRALPGRALCAVRGPPGVDERWKQEDHLSLVAAIRRQQVNRLRSASIHTLEQIARAPLKPAAQFAPRTFEALPDQAGLQLRKRRAGVLDWTKRRSASIVGSALSLRHNGCSRGCPENPSAVSRRRNAPSSTQYAPWRSTIRAFS